MSANEIHKDDVGTIFRVTIKDGDTVVDVSEAIVKTIKLRKNSYTVLVKTAEFYDDGVDGKIQHTAVAGDLDEIGNLDIQGYVELASGTWHSDISRKTVHDNLQTPE